MMCGALPQAKHGQICLVLILARRVVAMIINPCFNFQLLDIPWRFGLSSAGIVYASSLHLLLLLTIGAVPIVDSHRQGTLLAGVRAALTTEQLEAAIRVSHSSRCVAAIPAGLRRWFRSWCHDYQSLF